MRGLWGNFWFRTTIVAAFALIISSLLSAWPILAFVLAPGYGVLDFAGGAVVSWTLLLPCLCLIPFWIAVEVIARNRGQILPLVSYLIFITFFFLGMTLIPLGATGFVTPGGNTLLTVVCAIIAAAIAYAPAWLYARLVYRKPRKTSPDVF
ncbi:MAG: hypothetical protein QM647_17665 [Asticcacaulis sp.]|uniref:hypothetical protein n=1 Tax=Asticcacaulis sp. TaxID=1872648 RepID=UPI0039E68F8C